MTMGKKTQIGRKSNLELFRIITMLLIIAHHYVVNSGLMSVGGPIEKNPLSFHSVFLLLFGAWGKIGINCFVLFSGYFMCNKSITLKKYLKLLCEVLFYKIVIAVVFWITGYEKITVAGLMQVLVPVRNLGDGFTSAYLVFFLFIPFLNILVHHMTEKQHIRLLALVSFAYIFLGTFSPITSVTMNYASWFIVLYLISSYLRLYPKKLFENTKIWGIATIGCIIVSSASVIVCTWIGAKLNKPLYYNFVSDSNTLLAVLTGVSSFLFFKNVKVRQSRFINTVASTTFGVLCIHASSDAMRQWLWKDTLNNVGYYSTRIGYLHAIASVLAIFVICSMIDYIRIQLIERPFFNIVDKKTASITAGYTKAEDRFFDKLGIH